MELIAEKGHPFVEELQKVSNIVLLGAGNFPPRGLVAVTGIVI